jgi:hypothetical protein
MLHKIGTAILRCFLFYDLLSDARRPRLQWQIEVECA